MKTANRIWIMIAQEDIVICFMRVMIPMKGEAREAPLAIAYVKDSSGK